MALIFFHIKPKPLFPWLSKPFIIQLHSTSLIPPTPQHRQRLISTVNHWSCSLEMSSLTLAFSKRIHILPMKAFLVLPNLIFYTSEFIGICDMCDATLYFILFYLRFLCAPHNFQKDLQRYLSRQHLLMFDHCFLPMFLISSTQSLALSRQVPYLMLHFEMQHGKMEKTQVQKLKDLNPNIILLQIDNVTLGELLEARLTKLYKNC